MVQSRPERRKPDLIYFAAFTWALDDTPVTTKEHQADLSDQIEKLRNKKKQMQNVASFKASDPRYVMVTEKLEKMRQKAEAGKALLGRLYVRESKTNKTSAKLDACEVVGDALSKDYNKTGNSVVKQVQKLLHIGQQLHFNNEATLSAGRDAVTMLESANAGEPDEAVPDPDSSDDELLQEVSGPSLIQPRDPHN